MLKEITDRRVQKTRKLLKDALLALISEKGFSSVTIQDILDRANVGRSTFYMHFENKDDLLHGCFEDFNGLFEQHNNEILRSKQGREGFYDSEFTLNLFRFIEQNYMLFKAILGKDGIPEFSSHVQEYIFTHVNDALKATSQKQQDPLRTEILAHYLTSAFIGTLKWWIDKDMPCSVEVLDGNFKKFALYDIQQVLG